mmetsp:Transcript_7466/g.23953  ORF Transcript_7466/g.23953 Transcript_7466/m.23953 type:complete len:421 (+) Transcript_7466:32-1294(+)
MEFQSRIFLEHEDTTGRGGRPARTGEPQPHTAEMREHTSCTRARYVRLSISRDYRSQRPAQTQITASPSAPFSAIEKEGWRERKAAVQRASARFEARAQVRVAERLRSGSEVDEQMLECAESAHQLALPRLAKARLVRLDEGGARGPREGGTREGRDDRRRTGGAAVAAALVAHADGGRDWSEGGNHPPAGSAHLTKRALERRGQVELGGGLRPLVALAARRRSGAPGSGALREEAGGGGGELGLAQPSQRAAHHHLDGQHRVDSLDKRGGASLEGEQAVRIDAPQRAESRVERAASRRRRVPRLPRLLGRGSRQPDQPQAVAQLIRSRNRGPLRRRRRHDLRLDSCDLVEEREQRRLLGVVRAVADVKVARRVERRQVAVELGEGSLQGEAGRAPAVLGAQVARHPETHCREVVHVRQG